MGTWNLGRDTSQKSSETAEVDNGVPSPEMVQKIKDDAAKQEQLDRLDTLTESHLKTQTETLNGVTVLRDRKLFINYMKSKQVDTVNELLRELGVVQVFLKQAGVRFSKPDIMTIIVSLDSENTKWDMCAELAQSKNQLKQNNEYMLVISEWCQSRVQNSPKQ